MMTTQTAEAEDLVRAGIEALRAGDRERARALLMRAVRTNPRSEQAWLYLAGALADPAQRRDCLERVLQLNPANPAARRGLEALGTAPGRPGPAPTPPPALARPEAAPPAPPAAPAPAAPEPRPPAAATAGPPEAAPAPTAQPPISLRTIVEPAAQPTPRGPGAFDAYLPPAALAAPAAPAPTSGPGPLPAPRLDSESLPGLARGPAAATNAPAPREDRLTLWLALVLGVLLMLVSAGYLLLLLG